MSEAPNEVSVQAMDALLEKIFKLKNEIDERDAITSELNKELAKLKAEATENLKALERTSYKSAHGSIHIKTSWRFSLPQSPEEKEKAFKHFRDVGGKELLYQYATINANAYSAYCNERWEEAKQKGEGMEYRSPHGGEAKVFETVSLTKGSS